MSRRLLAVAVGCVILSACSDDGPTPSEPSEDLSEQSGEAEVDLGALGDSVVDGVITQATDDGPVTVQFDGSELTAEAIGVQGVRAEDVDSEAPWTRAIVQLSSTGSPVPYNAGEGADVEVLFACAGSRYPANAGDVDDGRFPEALGDEGPNEPDLDEISGDVTLRVGWEPVNGVCSDELPLSVVLWGDFDPVPGSVETDFGRYVVVADASQLYTELGDT